MSLLTRKVLSSFLLAIAGGLPGVVFAGSKFVPITVKDDPLLHKYDAYISQLASLRGAAEFQLVAPVKTMSLADFKIDLDQRIEAMERTRGRRSVDGAIVQSTDVVDLYIGVRDQVSRGNFEAIYALPLRIEKIEDDGTIVYQNKKFGVLAFSERKFRKEEREQFRGDNGLITRTVLSTFDGQRTYYSAGSDRVNSLPRHEVKDIDMEAEGNTGRIRFQDPRSALFVPITDSILYRKNSVTIFRSEASDTVTYVAVSDPDVVDLEPYVGHAMKAILRKEDGLPIYTAMGSWSVMKIQPIRANRLHYSEPLLVGGVRWPASVEIEYYLADGSLVDGAPHLMSFSALENESAHENDESFVVPEPTTHFAKVFKLNDSEHFDE